MSREASGADERFMRRALELARRAREQGEVPVGAVVVLDGGVPLVLAFVFKVTNPNDHAITLEELRFAYAFEAKGQFFTLNSPAVYEMQSIPARATNQVRVVSVLDSAIVPSTLAVTQGFKMAELGVKAPELVKTWWETIGDFAYAIRVSEGVATFTAGKASSIATFAEVFRKK